MADTKNQILYVDDEQENLDIFEINFSKAFHIHISINAEDAFKILKKNKIKVVLTDQRMPNTTGIEFIRQLKELYPDIVCIILTGYADKEVLFKAINEVDVYWFIEKPWENQEVIHVIDNAIKKYDAEKEKQRINIELKEALEKAQESDHIKTEFLSSISHEIRTPVNGIVGFLSLIKASESENEDNSKYLNIVIKSAHRLVELVDDMIIASRLHAGELKVKQQEVNINDLMEEIYQTIRPGFEENPQVKIQAHKCEHKENCIISTDKSRLSNIFIPLIKNAIKFTKQGHVDYGVYDEKDMVFFVKDTGSGISETDQAFIFDYFRQGKQKINSGEISGVGIGLSIVKGLVELLNGKIWFESQKGEGTTFYFQLPLNNIEKELL